MKTYFAILHKDADSAVGVVFPDLPGCFSAGDSYDEAIHNAEAALRLYAEAEAKAGRDLPEPRSFEDLYADCEVRDEARPAPFVGVPLTRFARGSAGIYRSAASGEYVSTDGAEQPTGFKEDGPPASKKR